MAEKVQMGAKTVGQNKPTGQGNPPYVFSFLHASGLESNPTSKECAKTVKVKCRNHASHSTKNSNSLPGQDVTAS